VINRAINTAQEQKRYVFIEEEISGEDLAAIGWLVSDEPTPEESMIQAELQQSVWEAIQKLTPKQRAVIVMRYFLDFSEAEMVRKLDSPLSSVKWWLHSARKKLRGLLQLRGYDNCSSEQQISLDQKKE
jgi:RNA polymerase sigma factor (sigma-70 family)